MIVETENLVENGKIHPDDVHVPGVYVNRIVHFPKYKIPIEHRTVRAHGGSKSHANDPKQLIACRAALEFANGMCVNLGIGIPTEAANYPRWRQCHAAV